MFFIGLFRVHLFFRFLERPPTVQNSYPSDPILDRLTCWAEGQPLVRAMILSSTRAIPNTTPDIFSDYDVILALSDVRPFFESREWLAAFGTVLVMYRDPLDNRDGFLQSGNVVQFEEGLKIDFSLWQAEYLHQIAANPPLQDELDAGYRILLDKDGLTRGLQPPTYKAYIPRPPTETEYLEAIEDSFLVATYVAKYIQRGDLIAAKHILDNFLKQEHLRPMLEWHYEIDHHWSVKPGLHGRRMQQWLRPDLYADLQSTYTGAGFEENWQALFNTLALLRKAVLEVGARLGFAYPAEMERRTLAYLQKIKNIGRIR